MRSASYNLCSRKKMHKKLVFYFITQSDTKKGANKSSTLHSKTKNKNEKKKLDKYKKRKEIVTTIYYHLNHCLCHMQIS
jgi:hypothetical protein